MRLIFLLSLAASLAVAASPDPVKLDTGLIAGAAGATPEMHIYRGIPYAAPPVGNLRWRAPQPPARWEGVRKAEQFGPVCTQTNPQSREDCLYLNVWTAAKPGEKLPVMLWIYGGGYSQGSGSQPDYDGEALARKGAVVVTFNYRLGALGFFAHPELTQESGGKGAANFGLLDAIAALQWIQRNIAAFGADTGRVTIFGESAGSGMVSNLMASPLAKGLFHRAIGESGGWNTSSIGKLRSLAMAEQAGVKFAEGLGVKSLAALRAEPAAAMVTGGRGGGPVVDGWSIPQDPGVAFAEGKQNDVPVLVGSNRDESFGGHPATVEEYVERARNQYGPLADTFLQLYPAASVEQAQDSAFIAGRDEMAWLMRNWARSAQSTGKSRSWVYFFTKQPPVLPNATGPLTPNKFGTATHTSEIVYVFQNLRAPRAWTDSDRRVSDAMSTYWVNFAAGGDPNGKGLPEWPPFDAVKNPGALVLGDKIENGSVLNPRQIAFFQAYYDSLFAKK